MIAYVSAPTHFDTWFILRVGNLLGRNRVFDLAVESGVRHHVLGGFWFAACAFVCWTQGARSSGEVVRRRVLTTLFGSLVAVTLALLAGETVSWLPPSRSPNLSHLYPDYLMANINVNSFPSQSTAVDTAVALGVLSLQRTVGSVLLAAVLMLVSAPRLYLGGHYPTDIAAGLLLGLIGYLAARVLLEPSVSSHLGEVFERENWLRVLGEVLVFIWILQIAVDFGDVVWIKHALAYVSGYTLHPLP